jgi:hypothetical protein
VKKYYTFHNLEKKGRLGNQLWQVASLIGLAKRDEAIPRIKPNWTYREYFNIPEEYYGHSPGEGYTVDLGKSYLQRYENFSFMKDDIISYLTPRINCPPVSGGAVSLHIRRGDYLKKPQSHPVLSISYYEAAITNIKARFGNDFLLYVFTDDPGWVWANVRLDVPELFYPSGKCHITDLTMMTKCRAHIISNSTFAWWGAFLSQSEVVYYPSVWFGEKYSNIDWRQMMPDWWCNVNAA